MQKTVYDLGMCYAKDAAFYLEKGFRVIAVEANPAAVAQARDRFSDYVQSGALTIVNKAIADEPVTIPFFVCDEKIWLSTASEKLVAQWERSGEVFRRIDVSSMQLQELFASHPAPHYVKIDIEGFDLLALRQIADSPVRPNYISAEIDIAQSQRMLAILQSMGYVRFALVRQSQVPLQVEPEQAREGRYSGAPLQRGQTGLFGDDLPNDVWVQAGTMRRILWALHVECFAAATTLKLGALLRAPRLANWIVTQAFSRGYDWFDIHARRD